MTLFQYLASIKPDYEDATLDMVITKSGVSDAEYAASKGRPYIQVDEGSVRVRKRWNQGVLYSRIVYVRIFQSPDPDGSSPSYAKITDVWNKVIEAPSHVTKNSYGDNLITIKCIGGFSPHHHVDSGGVAAEATFVIEFARES